MENNNVERYSLCTSEIEEILKIIPKEIREKIKEKLTQNQVILEFTRDDIENELAVRYDNSGDTDYDMTSTEFKNTIEEIIAYSKGDGFGDTNDMFLQELGDIIDKFC